MSDREVMRLGDKVRREALLELGLEIASGQVVDQPLWPRTHSRADKASRGDEEAAAEVAKLRGGLVRPVPDPCIHSSVQSAAGDHDQGQAG